MVPVAVMDSDISPLITVLSRRSLYVWPWSRRKAGCLCRYRHNGYGDKDNLFLVHILYIIIGF